MDQQRREHGDIAGDTSGYARKIQGKESFPELFKREHDLKAGVMDNARCTICMRCGALWWTPKPGDISQYSPRYCPILYRKHRRGPPVGVYVLMNDAKGKLP